jgi:tRNA A-37 threonylcarbamoyl transferase component Bud32/tetratricopeptide (TPR) repeat protein
MFAELAASIPQIRVEVPLIAKRYELASPFGRGATSIVYKARDLWLDMDVALKIMTDQRSRDPAFRRRWQTEVILARSVAHPNLVRIFDVGMDGENLFLSMEQIEGEPLSTRELDAHALCQIASDLLEGLGCLHDARIVHRDIKPSNVMVRSSGRGVLIDFGLAGILNGEAQYVWAGTPRYAAPEYLQGEPASIRTDLYSMGRTLAERIALLKDAAEREIFAMWTAQMTAPRAEDRFTTARNARDALSGIALLLERRVAKNTSRRVIAVVLRPTEDASRLMRVVAELGAARTKIAETGLVVAFFDPREHGDKELEKALLFALRTSPWVRGTWVEAHTIGAESDTGEASRWNSCLVHDEIRIEGSLASRAMDRFLFEKASAVTKLIGVKASDLHGRRRTHRTIYGRDDEVSKAILALRSTAVVWVQGPPGIGKSALLDEIARRIDPSASAILHVGRAGTSSLSSIRAFFSAAYELLVVRRSSGSCARLSESAYEVEWKNAIGAFARVRDPRGEGGLESGLYAAFEDDTAREPEDRIADVGRAVSLVSRQLSDLGFIPFIDDLDQWDHVSRRIWLESIEHESFCAVVSSRDSKIRWPSSLRVHLLALSDLSESACRDWVLTETALSKDDPMLAERLHHFGGYPELIAAWIAQIRFLGSLDNDPDIMRAVQRRLDALPHALVLTLVKAALLGSSLESDILSSDEVGVPVADRATFIHAGLLAPSGTRFRSEKLRLSVIELCAESDRKVLACDAARMLEKWALDRGRKGAHAERIARLYDLADERDVAASWFADAAFYATRMGDGEAAIELTHEAEARGKRDCDLALLRASVYRYVGMPQGQDEALEEAQERASSESEIARVLCQRAYHALRRAGTDDAIEYATRATDTSRSLPSDEHAAALAVLAFALGLGGRLEQAEQTAREALALGTEPRARLQAFDALGLVATQRGDIGLALDSYERARDIYVSERRWREAASAEANLADSFNRIGRYEEALALLEVVRGRATHLKNQLANGWSEVNSAYALMELGRMNDATAALERARALGSIDERLTLAIEIYEARLFARTNSFQAAISRSRALLERPGLPRDLGLLASFVFVHALRYEGALSEAIIALEDADARLDALGSAPEDRGTFELDAIAILARTGDGDALDARIAKACEWLHDSAQRIQNAEVRDAFLSRVSSHRELLELRASIE